MSTTETKSKKTSSSKSSKNDSTDKKDTDDISVEEVHTANNWEGADLGNEQRKQKFLRLMGAKKRKDETSIDRQHSHSSIHSDDGAPEKKHCRSKVEDETINRELEKQFNEGLQSKINHTHHGGLGFHGDNSSASTTGDWQHQPPETIFIPAKTDDGASMDHVKVDQDKQITDTTSDKSEEKKKKKSKS